MTRHPVGRIFAAFVLWQLLCCAVPAGAERFALADRVFTWACVFHNTPPKKLASSLAGMLVLDPDGVLASDVPRIKSGGKLLVGYLSVGEVEDYRRWFKAPGIASLTIRENPHWKGNFLVDFRRQEWQSLIASVAMEILDKGFDGLFLDTVNSFEQLPNPREGKSAMCDLVVELCTRIRSRHPDAYVILQNADSLFDDPRVFKAVDGINQESLYHSWLTGAVPESERRHKLEKLIDLRRQGKFVSLLEYTRTSTHIKRTKRIAQHHGFIPYFSTKELDTLFPIP